MKVEFHDSWQEVLQTEFDQAYFSLIKGFIIRERKLGHTFYPEGQNIFNAFNSTPFDQVKVIILGQDPYHGPGQAHGLSFSVPNGIKPPPSLKNIFKEIHQDLGLPIPDHGNLSKWADQGVLLLNAILTVRAHSPASHSKSGWATFTDAVIRTLSDQREHLIFLLWGKFAQQKSQLIDDEKHTILTAPHPSPFSVHRGFFGCGHFSKVNQILRQRGENGIDWQL